MMVNVVEKLSRSGATGPFKSEIVGVALTPTKARALAEQRAQSDGLRWTSEWIAGNDGDGWTRDAGEGLWFWIQPHAVVE